MAATVAAVVSGRLHADFIDKCFASANATHGAQSGDGAAAAGQSHVVRTPLAPAAAMWLEQVHLAPKAANLWAAGLPPPAACAAALALKPGSGLPDGPRPSSAPGRCSRRRSSEAKLPPAFRLPVLQGLTHGVLVAKRLRAQVLAPKVKLPCPHPRRRLWPESQVWTSSNGVSLPLCCT